MGLSYTYGVSMCAPVPVLVYIITIASRVMPCFLLCRDTIPVYSYISLHGVDEAYTDTL